MTLISPRTRLESLDGIRGLAILAVLFNHITFSNLPSFLSPIGTIIFSSGIFGVSFLFVLSGFLMAYIYSEPKSELYFLQKRYTRIFPLFLSMSTVMFLFRLFPVLIGLWGIILILSIALIVHAIWVYGIKKLPSKIGTMLFKLFLLIQLLMAGFYAFWIMRHPPIVFNQNISSFLREGTIGLVNSTLTLPFGNYIPMLDGVYWSLASEILFYILYPIICVSVINLLHPNKKIIKITFLITLAPLIAGMDILSRRILGFSMLQLPLFYCFVTGMTLGYLYKKKPEFVLKLTGIFKNRTSILSVVFFIGAIYFYHLVLDAETLWSPVLHIFFAIPFAYIVALTLDKRNILSKIFSSRMLIFFGIISYSVYLSHAPVIHIVDALHKTSTMTGFIIHILLIVLFTIIISKILYILLEKPYFIKAKPVHEKLSQLNAGKTYSGTKALLAICLLYIFAIIFAYQSTFNFFSIEYPVRQNIITISNLNKEQELISMKEFPVVSMLIKAPENNLGIIAMNFKNESKFKNIDGSLTFRIKEQGKNEWYETTGHDLRIIKIGDNYPFGFNPIQNSKGKIYQVELLFNNFSSIDRDYISIDTSEKSIRTVYPVDKLRLIKNPIKLMLFVQEKLSNVLKNKEARLAILFFAPFFITCIFVLIKNKFSLKKNKNHNN